MKGRKFLTRIFSGWIPAMIIFIMFGQASFAHGAGRLLVWPATEATARAESNVSLEPHELRKGGIVLAPGIVLPAPEAARQAQNIVSKGESVDLSFFPDVTYQITADSQQRLPDGTVTVSARLEDHRIGTVVLTVGPEGFLITLQDLNRGRLYRATGDSRSSMGTVTEIDVTKMPPVIR
jgi:hypothetical protein